MFDSTDAERTKTADEMPGSRKLPSVSDRSKNDVWRLVTAAS